MTHTILSSLTPLLLAIDPGAVGGVVLTSLVVAFLAAVLTVKRLLYVCQPNEVLIFSELMDSQSLFLTANADTVYYLSFLDLSDGPLVLETPPPLEFVVYDEDGNEVASDEFMEDEDEEDDSLAWVTKN